MDIKEITEGKLDGQIVWICDYRYRNFDEKIARHIKPTKVIVKSNSDLPRNKRVYYSKSHFLVLGKGDKPSSKIYAPYDNTGFRGRTGVPLQAFHTEQECMEAYKQLAIEAKKEFVEYKDNKIAGLNYIERELDLIINLKP